MIGYVRLLPLLLIRAKVFSHQCRRQNMLSDWFRQFGIQYHFGPKKMALREGPEQAGMRHVFPACASQVWMSHLRLYYLGPS